MKRSLIMTANIIAISVGLVASTASAGENTRLKRQTATIKQVQKVQKTQRHMKLATKPLQGTSTVKPDLIIVPWHNGNSGLPNSGYCGPWNGGNQKVYFYVRNVGTVAAPASDVYVGFTEGGTSEIAVPALASGQQVLRSKTIPLAAWGGSQYHGSVNFLIAADHNDDMSEISETNNYGQSTCIGPAS